MRGGWVGAGVWDKVLKKKTFFFIDTFPKLGGGQNTSEIFQEVPQNTTQQENIPSHSIARDPEALKRFRTVDPHPPPFRTKS